MHIASVLLCFLVLGTLHTARGRPLVERGCRKRRPFANLRITNETVIDLTYAFDENSPRYPTIPGFELTEHFKGYVDTPNRRYYAMNNYKSAEHLGTHVDAPSHGQENGENIDQISLLTLISRGVLIDLEKDGMPFPQDTFFTTEHFLEWERKHGRIRSGSIVLVYTGYGKFYGDYKKYYVTNTTGPEAALDLHFPGIDPDAARWLAEHRCIAAIGSDTMSIDIGKSRDFVAHQILLGEANVLIFENVANLDKLRNTGKGFEIVAMPMKIKQGTGAPTRIMAVLDKK